MPAMSPCPQSVLVSPHCVCLHSTSVRHQLNTEDEELRSAGPGSGRHRDHRDHWHWPGTGAGVELATLTTCHAANIYADLHRSTHAAHFVILVIYLKQVNTVNIYCSPPLRTCRAFCHTRHLSETGNTFCHTCHTSYSSNPGCGKYTDFNCQFYGEQWGLKC